ncbi:glycosyltransferase family 1 protein [Salmonella enterica subsp. salamae serovar 56:b:[1,5]]|uniref:WfbG n=2 Tax=Salmonella enterica TaxID=28901 RepID=D7PFA1_SALER|nr:glycosyltransferase family 4 protein [Salmonella enterica]ADI77009.1 WfbG [Salmonella enterica]AXC85537.1 glycosyltransferase family 1 protein [Salmonella enterica subsp. salamae serovar 56:b:[1,5]]
MHIILITNTLSSIFLFRMRLISKLIERGDHISVLIPHYESSNNSADILKNMGVSVYFYRSSRTGVNPFVEVLTVISIFNVLQKIKPDVVFSFFPKPIVFGTIGAKLARVKRIVSMFEGLGYCFTIRKNSGSIKKSILKFIQLILYKLFLRFSDIVLFLNKDDANELLVKHRIKVKSFDVVGGIGVNLEQYSYNSLVSHNEPLVFTMVSRLLIDKGIREYVAAAKIVKEKYPATVIQVVGGIDDNLGGITPQELEKWKLDKSVNFTGPVSDISKELIKTSVFVLPSYREGVPRSTQEALAIGLPVITTDVPGCRETVINNLNGFLIPPWDSNELAKKMIFFIENPYIICQMGKQSRLLAEEKFNEEVFCNKLINILSISDVN